MERLNWRQQQKRSVVQDFAEGTHGCRTCNKRGVLQRVTQPQRGREKVTTFKNGYDIEKLTQTECQTPGLMEELH